MGSLTGFAVEKGAGEDGEDIAHRAQDLKRVIIDK